MYPYIPDGIYAEIRLLNELLNRAQGELVRLMDRIWSQQDQVQRMSQ